MTRDDYADDSLVMKQWTSANDINEFVERRAVDPHIIRGNLVWNFSNHPLDEMAARQAIRGEERSRFVVPFQVTPVWGYMQALLPRKIREARILTYVEKYGVYRPYTNYWAVTTWEERKTVRERIGEGVEEVVDAARQRGDQA